MGACTLAALISTSWLNTAPRMSPMRPVHRPSRVSKVSAIILTGSTLEATLKMQCDLSGAGYSIFWANVGGSLVVAGDYTTDARRAASESRGLSKTFAEESESYSLSLDGSGPVSDAFRSNRPIFVKDIQSSEMTRKELAKKYDLAEIAFVPDEGGVLEIGTCRTSETATWSQVPQTMPLPKAQIRKAYEALGASYTMLWEQNSAGKFVVVADHVTSARRIALKKTRGDDKTFCSESRVYELDASGSGPVATAWRDGEEIVIADTSTMKRAELAEEFGISNVHFVPVPGGVLEYGTPKNLYLESSLLDATLKLRVDTSGAGYAMYWKEANEQFTLAADYTSPARRLALLKAGRDGESFAAASEKVTIDLTCEGPVATVFRTQTPMFIEDAAHCDKLARKELAEAQGIASICLVPVEGGVIEYGTSTSRETVTWRTIADAYPDFVPRDEMRKAFGNGATHMIFWRLIGEQFVCRGDYVLPERVRALRQSRGDTKSYTSESEEYTFKLSGDGPIARAYRTRTEVVIENAADATTFKRKDLATEFGVGNIHFVPTDDGVLEYGTASTATSTGLFGDVTVIA